MIAAQPSPPGRAPDYAATIAALARPADARALALPIMHLVMALRLTTLFEIARRQPLAELTQRFRSVGAALAVLRLARAIARTWPEPYLPGRPCCLELTPDEHTLAALARAAARADREAFSAAIAGFVRPDRHDRLFAATIAAIAEVPGGSA